VVDSFILFFLKTPWNLPKKICREHVVSLSLINLKNPMWKKTIQISCEARGKKDAFHIGGK